MSHFSNKVIYFFGLSSFINFKGASLPPTLHKITPHAKITLKCTPDHSKNKQQLIENAAVKMTDREITAMIISHCMPD
jgi:hypothetical protein